MSQRARFQQGMVYRVKRKQGPDCWIFRWREEGADGKRVRRKVTLGTVKEYPTETSALKAAQVLRVTINAEQSQSSQQPVSVLALINHFKEHELGPIENGEEEEGRAYSTRSTYIDILDFHVAKKWGKYRLADVRTIAVEKWLRKLELARGSKAKIRSIMSVLFNHAIRHEFLPQGGNPITMVRQSAKRMRAPDILEVSELINLFGQLAHRDRAMVLLDEPFAEVTAPNQLWCMDFKGWFRTGDGNRCDPFTITDAYNRYLIHCREVARMDTAHVLAICEAAMCEYRLWGLIRSTAHKSIASGKPG